MIDGLWKVSVEGKALLVINVDRASWGGSAWQGGCRQGRGCGRQEIRSWGACSILLRSLDFILWLVERTEGCKQLIELVPVTVSCARLLQMLH